MLSCGASTQNTMTPCTRSNATSRACKAGSTGSKRLNKQLTEERDQFLERYYRLVTQFELMGGSSSIGRAPCITDAIGYLRGRPEKHERHEIAALPVSKSLSNGNGNGNGLENGIAKFAEAIEDERRREKNENS